MERELVCVLFPGIVNDDEKAIECLGGLKNISQVYSQLNKKRLGLSFQPNNPLVKKTYADCKKTAGVLLKVKVGRTRVGDEIKREVLATSIVGQVKHIFKFESLFDFQYLPVQTDKTGKSECVIEQILPSGLDNCDFLLAPAPTYIIPAVYSRSDKPQNYGYTVKKYPEKEEDDSDVHHKRRADRGLVTSHVLFNLIDEFPTEPHEFYVNNKKLRIKTNPDFEKEYDIVKKLFDERPIWSTNLLRYHTKIKLQTLKLIMPCIAFHMKNGPWRMLWVKYGYDPRKDPGARIYQSLDFRLRHTAGLYSMVLTRDKVVHNKKADRVRQSHSSTMDDSSSYEEVSEGAVYFRPGMAPAQRQIFYQYCDIKLPEVEELLAANPPAGYLCHQKRGWLPPSAAEACRDYVFKYVKQTLLATHNADMKIEQMSTDDSSNSEEEATSTIDPDHSALD